MGKVIILEIFSCSGGMAEGFRRAGLEVDMAFDRAPEACASYEANLGRRPVQIDVRDLARMVGAGFGPRPGKVELLIADPPCTPWSRAGKRQGLADERDCLEVTIDLIAMLRPSAYLIGNVPGLQDARNWKIVQRMVGGLAGAGYCVRDFSELDAADYGVPQHRVRPFWYGHRGGPCIRWPTSTHGPIPSIGLPGLGLHPYVTVSEALARLDPEEMGRPVRVRQGRSDDPQSQRHGRWNEPSLTLTETGSRGPRGSQIVMLPERRPDPNRPPGALDAPARTVTTARDQALLEWPWDRPATTVHCDPRIMPPGHHEGSDMSRPNAIVLSERAAAILQGFPDGWKFVGATKRSRWAQIGQAMPPPLAEAIARSVRAQLESSRMMQRAEVAL